MEISRELSKAVWILFHDRWGPIIRIPVLKEEQAISCSIDAPSLDDMPYCVVKFRRIAMRMYGYNLEGEYGYWGVYQRIV